MAGADSRMYAGFGMFRRRCAAALVAVTLLVVVVPVAAKPRQWADVTEALLDTARAHKKTLEASIARRERDVRATAASLDRNTELFARGLITREELDAAAREAGEARAQLEWARMEIQRAGILIAEIDARRRLATLPPLRPGQYEASEGFIRYAGARAFTPRGDLVALERYFVQRVGRPLPVSASGQTDFHTRLGLDHSRAVDLALHPDSVEGRLVMGWLREQGIPFLGFRGPRSGAATGAHIHVGPPSERVTAAR
jgi:hypothetical protein